MKILPVTFLVAALNQMVFVIVVVVLLPRYDVYIRDF